MLLLAWLPAVVFGVGFFSWENFQFNPEYRDATLFFLQGMPQAETLVNAVETYESGDPTAARHAVWAWLLLSFFRYPQGVLMVLLVGLIAPSLISQDIRSRAFLLYFSSPLTRWEYVSSESRPRSGDTC